MRGRRLFSQPWWVRWSVMKIGTRSTKVSVGAKLGNVIARRHQLLGETRGDVGALIHRQTRSAAKRDRTVAMAAMLFLMAFAAPATAMAASPVTDQYGSRSQQVAATGGGGSPGSGSSSGVGVNSAPTTGHGASDNARIRFRVALFLAC